MAGEHLTGRYRVRATQAAFADVNRMSLRARDRMEIRRQALKLRYWPSGNGGDGGQLMDLDWS
jgi:hypothetical protein